MKDEPTSGRRPSPTAPFFEQCVNFGLMLRHCVFTQILLVATMLPGLPAVAQ